MNHTRKQRHRNSVSSANLNPRKVSKRNSSRTPGSRPFSFKKNKASRNQITPRQTCKIASTCGSCTFVNQDYTTGLASKHAEGIKILRTNNILENATVTDPIASPRVLGYRNQAKLVFKASSDSQCGFQIGLYAPGSHNVIDTSGCAVQMPIINKWIEAFKVACIPLKNQISVWNPKEQQGTLRYLIVRAGFRSQEMQVTFVCSDNKLDNELKRVTRGMRDLFRISGVFVNLQSSSGNAIIGPKTNKLWGKSKLYSQLGNYEYQLTPESFFQLNSWQAENIYHRVGSLAGSQAFGDERKPIAWDLYAGQGAISMTLADRGFRVLAIEENPHSVAAGQANSKQITNPESVEYIAGRVEDVTAKIPTWAARPSMIVANPSRRGMATAVREQLQHYLQQTPSSVLIYISCDINSLARDLADFVKSGAQVKQVESYDMFAQTDKLEWLVVISR
ncbi:MAG: 23S rRNA (uracil(1939)-C(5))-methyltransferase RlmD [Zetaproteobacteria bacterium]|nr:23S rRNA (uracil(1939)-C(5))-methyltransferase RlmD [Zetaproteobacteria bacterium]